MEDIEDIQQFLERAKDSRERWRLLHAASTEAKDTVNADLAARQIERFDRIIELYELQSLSRAVTNQTAALPEHERTLLAVVEIRPS